MYYRSIVLEMIEWRNDPRRKPMILRGARQVGKSTVVDQFAHEFEQYIKVNLDEKEDRKLFEEYENMDDFLQQLFFKKKVSFSKKESTLIFIDEIQALPEAFNLLRYFYEKYPEIAVIAAGSMLETILNPDVTIPVGRVDFLVLRPFSFEEFLQASGEHDALEVMNTIPFPDYAYDRLMSLYHTYSIIGGMPEVVKTYVKTKDFIKIKKIYEGLIVTYLEDVEKYANHNTQIQVIRYIIRNAFYHANERITFQNFANSTYKSREVGEAFRTLEKCFLLHLIYPLTSSVLPKIPDIKKSPRLQVLDTGIANFMLGIQGEIMGTKDLSTIYKGRIIEHLVGQEILAASFSPLHQLDFWIRDKASSSAEVDYIMQFGSKLYPVEVKSGKEGKLKSLQLYMDQAEVDIAFRLNANKINIKHTQTPQGTKFILVSLPYFLGSKLDKYIEWSKTISRNEN